MDSIIAEIRQVREAIAKRFNYDVHAIVEEIRKRQAASGREIVRLSPRPVRKIEVNKMTSTRGVDERDPVRRALDEQIAAEPPLPMPKLPPDAVTSPVENVLGRRTRRPLAVDGVVVNGVV